MDFLNNFASNELLKMFAFVGVILVVATAIGQVLARAKPSPTIDNLNARTNAWWVMVILIGAAIWAGFTAIVILFAALSFFALREFLTLAPTVRGDHRALLWSFFLITPLQYWLVWTKWYGLFTILIPVYAFLFLPARSAWSGDTDKFLERTAKIQWALMICTYCLSHVPAIELLRIPGYEGRNSTLLFFYLLIVQISDVLQYVWGKLTGRHKIAPLVSPNKTVEGFVGGVLTATAIGAAMHGFTPFGVWQAAAISLAITLMGFAGGLVMSAIKRDRGVKDFGTIIAGHGGVLDRLDSICFSAPVYFHLVRYFYEP